MGEAKTKLVAEHFILGTAADLLRSKSALVAENAFLRQQVILLKRQVMHPKLTPTDRGLLVLLVSRVRHWKQALLIVKPGTLLKWHRQGFKLFWRQKSRGQARKPRISEEIIALIKQMARCMRKLHLWLLRSLPSVIRLCAWKRGIMDHGRKMSENEEREDSLSVAHHR